ncbi:MAG: hypothetical protein M0Z54_10435 [Thermaerobacter sp.]|nr:hypothetical protein [Thermaerobacter sp.]
MSAWSQVVVGTTHSELRTMSEASGAAVVDSCAALEAQLADPGTQGAVVTQDLEGLSVERVRRWAADHAVAVWLEEAPPPAWRALPSSVTVWHGELTEPTLAAWVETLVSPSGFGEDGHVLGVVGLAGGVGTTTAAWVWGQQWAARQAPVLWVDADWAQGGLTEKLAPTLWRDRRPPRPVACRGGTLLPSPAPWELTPPPEDAEAPSVVAAKVGVVVVDLGRDLRAWTAARWAALADHVVVIGHPEQGERAVEVVGLLRELHPGVEIAVKGTVLPGRHRGLASALPEGWPGGPRAASERREGGVPWHDWFQKKAAAAFNRSTHGSR